MNPMYILIISGDSQVPCPHIHQLHYTNKIQRVSIIQSPGGHHSLVHTLAVASIHTMPDPSCRAVQRSKRVTLLHMYRSLTTVMVCVSLSLRVRVRVKNIRPEGLIDRKHGSTPYHGGNGTVCDKYLDNSCWAFCLNALVAFREFLLPLGFGNLKAMTKFKGKTNVVLMPG